MGDIAIHTANTADAELLKEKSTPWVRTLGSRARVLKPTYGVLIHGVRTDKENVFGLISPQFIQRCSRMRIGFWIHADGSICTKVHYFP